MFESLKSAMLRHKQVLLAAVAVTGLLGYVIPTQPYAAATILSDAVGGTDLEGFFDDEDGGDTITETDNQENDQEIDQEQDQDLEQDIDQTQTNEQSNSISTGDNTAAISQDLANVAEDVSSRAAASSEGGDDHHDKHKKHKKYDGSRSGDGGDASATATTNVAQSIINDATIDQDSSADNNVQTNVNEFGDQNAANLARQDQDQRAANVGLNVDLDLDIPYNLAIPLR